MKRKRTAQDANKIQFRKARGFKLNRLHRWRRPTGGPAAPPPPRTPHPTIAASPPSAYRAAVRRDGMAEVPEEPNVAYTLELLPLQVLVKIFSNLGI